MSLPVFQPMVKFSAPLGRASWPLSLQHFLDCLLPREGHPASLPRCGSLRVTVSSGSGRASGRVCPYVRTSNAWRGWCGVVGRGDGRGELAGQFFPALIARPSRRACPLHLLPLRFLASGLECSLLRRIRGRLSEQVGGRAGGDGTVGGSIGGRPPRLPICEERASAGSKVWQHDTGLASTTGSKPNLTQPNPTRRPGSGRP